MLPIVLVCLGGGLVGVSAVWLYEFEHYFDPPVAVKMPDLTEAFMACVDFTQKYDGNGPPIQATNRLRTISNNELIQRVIEIESELRASERRHYSQLLGRVRNQLDNFQDEKEAHFQYLLLIRAASLAGELLFRLGDVEVPSGVDAAAIKLGEAIIASGKPAGQSPMLSVANYLIFLSGMLSR